MFDRAYPKRRLCDAIQVFSRRIFTRAHDHSGYILGNICLIFIGILCLIFIFLYSILWNRCFSFYYFCGAPKKLIRLRRSTDFICRDSITRFGNTLYIGNHRIFGVILVFLFMYTLYFAIKKQMRLKDIPSGVFSKTSSRHQIVSEKRSVMEILNTERCSILLTCHNLNNLNCYLVSVYNILLHIYTSIDETDNSNN